MVDPRPWARANLRGAAHPIPPLVTCLSSIIYNIIMFLLIIRAPMELNSLYIYLYKMND